MMSSSKTPSPTTFLREAKARGGARACSELGGSTTTGRAGANANSVVMPKDILLKTWKKKATSIDGSKKENKTHKIRSFLCGLAGLPRVATDSPQREEAGYR